METFNIMYRIKGLNITSDIVDGIDSDDAIIRLVNYYRSKDTFITILKVELITEKETKPICTIRYD